MECPHCEETSIEVTHNGTLHGIDFYECHRCDKLWHAAKEGTSPPHPNEFYNLELVDPDRILDNDLNQRVEAYHIDQVYKIACQMLEKKTKTTVINFWLVIRNGVLCLHDLISYQKGKYLHVSRQYVTIREAYEIEPDILALTIHGNDPYQGVTFTGEDEHDVFTQAGEWIKPRWDEKWGELPADVEDYLNAATNADGVYRYSITKVKSFPY